VQYFADSLRAKNEKRKTQSYSLKFKIEENVLNFELWFYAFRFKFLVLVV
jgi:hypothetical protein